MSKLKSVIDRVNVLFLIKAGVGSAIAILIASSLGLMYSPSAGIITLLTIQNTKRETINIAFKRILAFVIAVLISTLVFHTIGYTSIAFGMFALLFVGMCTICQLKDGIAMNAVLMTHFLIEKNMGIPLIFNEIALLFIGMTIGIMINLIMPKYGERIRLEQKEVEESMRRVIRSLGYLLQDKDACLLQATPINPSHSDKIKKDSLIGLQGELRYDQNQVTEEIEGLENLLVKLLQTAYEDAGNTLLNQTRYLVSYLEMRTHQLEVLKNIKEHIEQIPVVLNQSYPIVDFMKHTADTFHELNNVVGLLEELDGLKEYFRKEALPSTREEFEYRAILYQIVKQFEYFLKIKRNFVQNMNSEDKMTYWK